MRTRSFEAAMDELARWVRDVLIDLDTPDLWAALPTTGDGDGRLDAGGNTPFTPPEREQIEARLNEIRSDAREHYALSAEQLHALEKQLDYLAKAAAQVGRIDWRNLVAGAFLGALTDATLPPDVVRNVFGALVGGLSHLFGTPLPQLPG